MNKTDRTDMKFYMGLMVLLAFAGGLATAHVLNPKPAFKAGLYKGLPDKGNLVAVFESNQYADLPTTNCEETAKIANQSWQTSAYQCAPL